MTIKKQAFYEGAALYLLARAGAIEGIRYEPPFFVLNEDLRIYLKHSTKGRSPWGFTFTVEEQSALEKHSASKAIIAGLVCGGDGVVIGARISVYYGFFFRQNCTKYSKRFIRWSADFEI